MNSNTNVWNDVILFFYAFQAWENIPVPDGDILPCLPDFHYLSYSIKYQYRFY